MTAGAGPVLIVEDDADIRALLRRRASRWPFDIEEAASGEAALELLRQRTPALVVLDILLPGIDGWAVVQRMRSDPALRDVPVVVVSIVDQPDAPEVRSVQGYLSKPFHTADVDRLLAELLPAHSPPSSRADDPNGGP